MVKPKPIVKDFFGNVIEIGDRYFYGSPDVVGVVCNIKQKTIVIQLEKSPRSTYGNSKTMNCKSPDKGVCLDKIPGKGEVAYKVTWRVWKGVEPCGKADYISYKQYFGDLDQATSHFETKKLHHDDAAIFKITTEQLDD